jgi:PmbA protein
MIDEKEARKLSDSILARCKGSPAEVTLQFYDSALTRFANNIIHQNVAERDAEVTLRFFIGKQIGAATTNRMDEAGLDQLVERARANAKTSPEDPNYPGLPSPEAYQRVRSWDQNTASYSPEKRAKAVGVVCKIAMEKGLNASGAFSTGSGELVVANTNGVFTYHSQTSADFQTVVMSDDSSGRAQESAWKVDELNVEALGKQAIITAERGHNPRKVEPGDYTVVVEHYVTEDLISSLNFYGMGAQALEEGRSWMNDRIGKQVMCPM